MVNSPMPGVPQTAAKANVGALAVAATTVVLYVIARLTGWIEAPSDGLFQDAVTSLVIAIVGAVVTRVSVYLTPNKPLGILAAMLLAASLLGGALTACAPAGAKPGDQAAAYIDTAQIFVDSAIVVADTCVQKRWPLCVGKEAEVEQAKAVATEAMAEARRIAAEGGALNLVRATLRIAMNALLLFGPPD